MNVEQHRSQALPETAARRTIAWDWVLVIFMRLMAALWLVKGLSYWVTLLGIAIPGVATFESLPPPARAVVVVFAVLDLVAAVGLWLTSTWGGVMWLLAVMSHLLIGSVAPLGSHLLGVGGVVAEASAVVAYIVFSWLAAREA
ncbi:hypothetical protein GCM10007036_17790 [Alsobacter metallidurans]|uniref:Uncharacterized protein n=1 Tax=Alsobacter metallidurans TaxID=340221 RepID=A0A917I693_9HYPH|nr:DUF6163 family protein [Alsobacter metallidurans]GGH16808.1 hypothetical protein GCM10007036_17790 [Alsobacter metallidurans]